MELAPADLFNNMDSTDRSSLYQTPWEKFKRHPMGMSGLILLLMLGLFTLVGPYLSHYAYDEIHLTLKNQPPSAHFWFGTDDFGRDLFTRACYGARISFCVGLAAGLIDLTLGVLWGSIAGLAGRRIDELMMRLLDIFYSIPTILTAILISVVLGSGLFSIILAVNLISWITMARIVRGQMLLLKEMEYVLAARAMGAGFNRILFKHLLPNVWGPILVTLAMTIPSAIFSEAFLSFLGLGVQAPMASWGTMAYDGLPAMQFYPWRLFFPSILISITMLAFYLLGEGLKAAHIKTTSMNVP